MSSGEALHQFGELISFRWNLARLEGNKVTAEYKQHLSSHLDLDSVSVNIELVLFGVYTRLVRANCEDGASDQNPQDEHQTSC